MNFQAIYVFLILVISISLQQNLIRHVPFGTFTDTLRTRHKTACDGDILTMSCPSKTQIAIRVVHYGRTTESPIFCPPTFSYQLLPSYQDTTCNIMTAYSAVTEICHGKQNCAIVTSPTSLGVSKDDSCPGIRKNIEVRYHCVPANFDSKIICNEENLNLKCNNPEESISVLSSFMTSGAKDSSQCTPNKEYIDDKECEYKSSDVTHSVLRFCHGRNSCKFTREMSLLSGNDCKIHQSLLNITYTCIRRTNFNPEFLNRILTQEKHQIATTKETFKKKIKEQDFELILTAKSISPKRSVKQNNDNSKEENTIINKDIEDNVELILSVQKEGYVSKKENLMISQAMNLLFRIVSGFQQVTHVLQRNTLKFVSLMALSVVLPAACFVIFILIRALRRNNSEVNESETSDLESDLF